MTDFATTTTNLDTGPMSSTIDLLPYAGSSVVVNFMATVPESFTGPAHFQLDNVVLDVNVKPQVAALTNSTMGLNENSATNSFCSQVGQSEQPRPDPLSRTNAPVRMMAARDSSAHQVTVRYCSGERRRATTPC